MRSTEQREASHANSNSNSKTVIKLRIQHSRVELRQSGMYRVGRVRQAVEFLLHLFQDVCGGAALRFAVVDLVQDGVQNLSGDTKYTQFLLNQNRTYNRIF